MLTMSFTRVWTQDMGDRIDSQYRVIELEDKSIKKIQTEAQRQKKGIHGKTQEI